MPGQHRSSAEAQGAATASGAAHRVASPSGAHRRLASALGNVLLTIAAIGGVVCLVAVIAAVVFHVSLILFRTGSMSPGIPTGSVALVREIPASAARPGDVVTVDRPGALPITHRVVSVVAGSNGFAELTLRGDANPQSDPVPYGVDHVRLVIASLPGGAQAIVFVSNPYFLGSVTVAASVLVGWAFWPRRRDDDPPSSKRSPLPGALGMIALVVTVPLSSALGAPDAARASATETVISSRYLTLTSIADPLELAHLRPGVPGVWEVGVSAHPPDPAPIHLGLSATGVLAGPRGLLVSVVACSERWVGGACPGTRTEMLGSQPVATAVSSAGADGVRELGTMPSTQQRWLAVDVTLPSGWSPGSSADLRIHAWGVGDQVQTMVQSAGLANTGTGFSGAGAALAGAALLAGIGAATAERHRRRRASREPREQAPR